MLNNTETAVFGGGCFWCVEAIFNRINGVTSVISGYAGGALDNPTYYDVSEGNSGHAEVIKIEFDPSVISYNQLLEIFFDFHDPTTLNKQGYDTGTEYRSIILYTSDQQKTEALKMIEELSKHKRVVTELKEITTFYTAEEHHQKFYEKNSYTPYCSIVISPKIKHLEEKYKELLKN